MGLLDLLLGTDDDTKKEDDSIFNLFGLDDNQKKETMTFGTLRKKI